VTIAVPLFDGLASRAGVSQAGHQAAQAQAALDVARREAQAQAMQAYVASEHGDAQLSAMVSAVEAAQFAFDAVQQAYTYGKRTLTDLTLAEDKLFQAQRSLARAQFERLGNYARLRASVAELDEEFVLKLGSRVKQRSAPAS
jgi:outer membrane protein TolC